MGPYGISITDLFMVIVVRYYRIIIITGLAHTVVGSVRTMNPTMFFAWVPVGS